MKRLLHNLIVRCKIRSVEQKLDGKYSTREALLHDRLAELTKQLR